MTDLLDPKIDVIFKIMMANPENEDMLINMLSAILTPRSPIESAKVLNPEIPKKHLDDKGTLLDILAELGDGTRLNLEMQMNWHSCLPQRAHYYAARLFASQLKRGIQYQNLRKSISIFLLNDIGFKESRPGDFHYIFGMREEQNRASLEAMMLLHFIEIPKLISCIDTEIIDPFKMPLVDWVRFLYNPDDPLLVKEVFARMPAIKKAYKSLEEISASKEAREFARMREKARMDYESTMITVREEGRAEGRAEGRVEGRTEGETTAKFSLLENLLGHPTTSQLPPEDLAQMTNLPIDEVRSVLAKLLCRKNCRP